jgi:amino acid transporter
MLTHTLGRPVGWLTFALTLATLVVIPPVIALGTADYLAPIIGLDRALTGAVVMLLATATGILDIKSNAYVTGTFLLVETLAAAAVAWLGFSHTERGIDTLWNAQVSDGSSLSPFTAGILLSGLGIAIFTCSGFTTATYLAEEMVDARRNVKWAVLGSLGLGAAIIIIPTLATVLGVGSLNDLATGTYPEFITSWSSSRMSAAISVGIAVAILNAVIVMVIQNARVIYATGRDKAWPEPVNRALSTLHPRFGSPVVATLLAGVPGAFLAWRMDIEALLGITSVVLAAVYMLVAVAALFVRRAPHAGWKMPLWPVAPVLVIVGVGYALRESALVDVVAVLGILATAAVYYVAYLRPRSATHFVVDARADVE